MTFAEYNTDENFNKPSNAMELVRLGKEEGKTREEIADSLSPLWKEDKKGNVKKALDYHFNTETTPKAEETVTEKVTETAPKTTTDIKPRDKEHLEDTNAIADTQEQEELNRIAQNKDADYAQTFDTMKRSGEAFRNIDDKLIGQLPTFMLKRYINGEFGDPKSSDAKLRLSHFLLNGVQSKLKNVSNAAAVAAGRAPMFADTTSDYEKYQATNLDEGMKNRWNKYKQETQQAIDLVKNRDMTEEQAYDTVKTISRNQRLQTTFNMMNEKQKVYLMNVTKEIGDKIGSFSNDELIDFLTGAAVSGDQLTWQEAAAIAVAKFGPTALKAAKDNKDKVQGDEKTAGIGGSGNGKAVMSDGTKIDPGITMNDEEFNQLTSQADKLRGQYANGEITEEQFRSEYKKLTDVMAKHPLYRTFKNGIISADKQVKQVRDNKINELNASFEELNKNAGLSSYEDYVAEYDDIIANAKKWGVSDKLIKSLEKNKLTKDQHAKKVQKANKKK